MSALHISHSAEATAAGATAAVAQLNAGLGAVLQKSSQCSETKIPTKGYQKSRLVSVRIAMPSAHMNIVAAKAGRRRTAGEIALQVSLQVAPLTLDDPTRKALAAGPGKQCETVCCVGQVETRQVLSLVLQLVRLNFEPI